MPNFYFSQNVSLKSIISDEASPKYKCDKNLDYTNTQSNLEIEIMQCRCVCVRVQNLSQQITLDRHSGF